MIKNNIKKIKTLRDTIISYSLKIYWHYKLASEYVLLGHSWKQLYSYYKSFSFTGIKNI